MKVYGWVFKLYVRFCVWQLSGKNILFFTFNRSVNNAQFFFCQIYVCNGTNKRIQHTEFSFLPVSKAIKAVSCITDFGVSKEIYLAEHFVRNNNDSAYCNFLNIKLRHGYFSANITKFSEQVSLKHLQEHIKAYRKLVMRNQLHCIYTRKGFP